MYKGHTDSIKIKAPSKSEAIADSKKYAKGMVIKVEEIPMPIEEKVKVFSEIFKTSVFRQKLNMQAFISAIRQLTVLIKAGISLKDSLEDIAKNTFDPLVKKIFDDAAVAIDSGKSLSDVFMKYETYVGGLGLAMVRLGEQTGDLVSALERLADMYEQMYENRRKMMKALRYPIFTMLAIIGAFTFLVLVVVPKFKTVFDQLHTELPLPTRILLAIQHAFANYGIFIILGIILLIVTGIFLYRTSEDFKFKIDELMLKTYLINKIIEYSTLSRFLSTLSALLSSGIALVEALRISEGIVTNEVIKQKIQNIVKGVNQGRAFSEVLAEQELLNFVAIRMISAGEETGELDEMFNKAANYYEDKFQDIIDNMQAAIEPIMMIVIGALVLLLALGIFLPMWNMASAAKNL
jgi:general secretion pathway protein F/MSHA biogenesis protein MshG